MPRVFMSDLKSPDTWWKIGGEKVMVRDLILGMRGACLIGLKSCIVRTRLTPYQTLT